MARNEPLSDDALRALADAEFDQGMGGPGGDIAQERARAWDFYLSKPLGNEVEGQSSVVTSDVADVVDGIMPSLLRIFTIADNLVSFDAVGPEDVEKADQESDYVNYVFFKQNPAFLVLYTWFFDALTQKNGIVKCWFEEYEDVTQESYSGLSEVEIAELLDDEELEVVEHTERPGEDVIDVQAPEMPEGGLPMQIIVPAMVHDVVFRRVSKRGKVCVDNVPPEEFRISSDARSLDPSSARMVGHERNIKRSDLLDMGFKPEVVKMLPASSAATEKHRSPEGQARYEKTDDTMGPANDKSQDDIRVREIYMRVDQDGDGRSELRQIFTASGKLLGHEIVDRQPFHVISPQPMPHRHYGRSAADKVMDVQLVGTTLVRQILDNLYHTNQPSHGVWEQGIGENTLDDLLTARAGSVKRFARPVGESYQPITVPFTAGATFPMLQYWDKVKRDRTGITADGEGLTPEALKNIQTSVLSQASDLSRMKIEAIARIFAETGIKSLFLHIHELLLKHQDKPQLVMLRNRWEQVDPREWRTRRDMTVNIGLGIGTRHENLLHLNAIWEKQAIIVQNGGMGTLVKPMNLFNTLAEMVKNANLKNPELFFTPTDQVPQQGDKERELAEMQMQLAQRQQELDAARQELAQAKAMAENEREMMKIELQREKQDDTVMVEMEKIRNQLTEMELKYGQNVRGSAV